MTASSTSIDFRGKLILAPMVRVCTLPMRLLCLRYGADLAYTEEIIDYKIIKSRRIINNVLNTVDYVMPDGMIAFRTCAEETSRVIFQMGTSSPERAVKAALILAQDVAGIDINMGCPKDYSIKGGMGAALLTNPENASRIVSELVRALPRLPITAKIRILPNLKDTVAFACMLAEAGCAAVAVHARTKMQRRTEQCREHVIRAVAAALRNKNVPVIANGGSYFSVNFHRDIEFFRMSCDADSVMLAQIAMNNPGVFVRPAGDHEEEQDNADDATATTRDGAIVGRTEPPNREEMIAQYLRLAVRFDNHLASTKYVVGKFAYQLGELEIYRRHTQTNSVEALCEVWNCRDLWEEEISKRKSRTQQLQQQQKQQFDDDVTKNDATCKDAEKNSETEQQEDASKRETKEGENEEGRTENEEAESVGLIRDGVRLLPRRHRQQLKLWSSKWYLSQHCLTNQWPLPVYTTEENRETKSFTSKCRIEPGLFENRLGNKSKKQSEQAVAVICLKHLGLLDQESLDSLKIDDGGDDTACCVVR